MSLSKHHYHAEALVGTLVDAERIDRLRQAVSDLNDALGGLGA